MDNRHIVHLTDKGRLSLVSPGAGLSAIDRRLMVRINGRRDVETLDRYMRPGELRPSLRRLLDAGLVELRESADESAADADPTTPIDLENFEKLREDAIDWLLARECGPCDAVAAKISNIMTPRALRRLLREIEPQLTAAIGVIPSKEFLYLFGRRALKLSV